MPHTHNGPSRRESPREPAREPIWSVARKWLALCLGLIFAMTIGWTVLVARAVIGSGEYEGVTETAIAVVTIASSAVPLIVVYSMFIVVLLDTAGGAIVVTYRYLSDKFLEPQREKLRREGQEQGAAKVQRAWEDWLRRKEEAEGKGETFDEPPPVP